MFDPEYFMSEYKIRDLSSGTVRLASGRYRDFADVGPREEILHEDALRDERQTFYCVSVPGEAAWVQDVRKNDFPEFLDNTTKNIPSTSNPIRTAKRGLEDVESNGAPLADREIALTTEQMDVQESYEKNISMEESGGPATKKRTNNLDSCSNKEGSIANNEKSKSAEPSQRLNLPIPNSKGKSQFTDIKFIRPIHMLFKKFALIVKKI